jgi:hypothetical protein
MKMAVLWDVNLIHSANILEETAASIFFFFPEYGSSSFFQNAGNCTSLHGITSQKTLLLEPQISYVKHL